MGKEDQKKGGQEGWGATEDPEAFSAVARVGLSGHALYKGSAGRRGCGEERVQVWLQVGVEGVGWKGRLGEKMGEHEPNSML